MPILSDNTYSTVLPVCMLNIRIICLPVKVRTVMTNLSRRKRRRRTRTGRRKILTRLTELNERKRRKKIKARIEKEVVQKRTEKSLSQKV